MVVPNWEHPQVDRYDYRKRDYVKAYQPMRDEPFEKVMDEWIAEYQLWKSGNHPAQLSGRAKDCTDFSEWHGGPPRPEYYRPNWKPEEMTWVQLYETVTEGTPVSPPFATKEELVEYLVANGDLWDQDRRKRGVHDMNCEPWDRKVAERFVFGAGWAPSIVVADGKMMSGVEAM